VAALADEAPEFVTLQRQAPFFFERTVAWRGCWSYNSLT
jgi:hypothetical protein